MELLRGARSKKNYDILYNDIIVLRRLSMDASFWNRAWKYGYQLRKNGINVPLADILIATLAVEHGALLLHNDRHFIMMEESMSLHHEFLQ
jgi:hypothetical protein